MSGARRLGHALVVLALTFGLAATVGCGKYGKPKRRPPEPRNLSAQGLETQSSAAPTSENVGSAKQPQQRWKETK